MMAQAKYGDGAARQLAERRKADAAAAAAGDANLIPLGVRAEAAPAEQQPPEEPIPEVEWWDARILADATSYGGVVEGAPAQVRRPAAAAAAAGWRLGAAACCCCARPAPCSLLRSRVAKEAATAPGAGTAGASQGQLDRRRRPCPADAADLRPCFPSLCLPRSCGRVASLCTWSTPF